MTTTWLLVTGQYSDYRVHAAFNTKAAAEQAANRINELERAATKWRDLVTVEEVPRHTSTTRFEPVAITQRRIELVIVDNMPTIHKDTTTTTTVIDNWDPTPTFDISVHRPPRGNTLYVTIDGTDIARVHKVAAERRARYLSSLAEWPPVPA